MPFSTHVTPGVLDNTHKAFRDNDSTRKEFLAIIGQPGLPLQNV